MKHEIIRMDRITKTVNGVPVLNCMSLNIFRGEIVGVLGHSGSGKTTIAQILSGLQSFDSGYMYINEQRYMQVTPAVARSNHIFFIHKLSALIPNMSLAENIFVMKQSALRNPYINHKAIELEAAQLLSRVGLDFYSAKTPAYKLSDCERALVLLCRALASGSHLIILDSALENLTPKDRYHFYDVVKKLNKDGIAFLITERAPKYLLQVAERLFIIQDGSNLKTVYHDNFDIGYITQLLTQHSHSLKIVRESVATDIPALQIQHLSFEGYQDISFTVHKGEILSILDMENLFTKALANALLGKTRPAGGAILLNRKPIMPRSVDHAVRLGIGIIEHDAIKHGIFQSLDYSENCNLMILEKFKKSGIIQRNMEQYIRKTYNFLLPSSIKKARTPVSYFDVHAQNNILLTRWKIAAPPVLLCIDPGSMTDMVSRNMIFKMLDEYSQMQMGVLILTSDPDDALTISDRVFLYENGKLSSILI